MIVDNMWYTVIEHRQHANAAARPPGRDARAGSLDTGTSDPALRSGWQLGRPPMVDSGGGQPRPNWEAS